MLLKTNQDERELELLTLIENRVEQETETPCEKYDGMFESLSVDMLSGEETRLLAEHLAECPSCREGCAMLFSVGAYDDAPMRDRMNAYEENGAAEEDENWLKIAFMVNPKLKKAKANDETLKDAILTSTNSVDYKIEKERDNEPTLAPIAKSERRTERKREKNAILSWRDLAYAAAGFLVAFGILLMPENEREIALQTETPDAPNELVNSRAVGNSDETGARTPNATGTTKGGGASANTADETFSTGDSLSFGNSDETGARTLSATGTTKGGSASANTADEPFFLLDFGFEGEAERFYKEGAEAFDAGKYDAAAKKFEELRELLETELRAVSASKAARGSESENEAAINETSEEALNNALNVAYWNLAVATIEEGVKILQELGNRELGEGMRAQVDAALEKVANE